MPLNAKQKLFVKEYLRDKNATRAYKDSGYVAKGHSAENCASRLLSNDEVRRAVDKGLAAQADKADISAQRVIDRIAEHAFHKKLKATDTLKACEMLGKHFKLFTDVSEINGKLNVRPVQVVFRLPPGCAERAKEGKKGDGESGPGSAG